MKKILVLGAGMISRPLVRYLLDQPDYFIKMASRTVRKAERIINSHKRGEAISFNVSDDSLLEQLVSKSDVVVSLLPYIYHVKVAKLCIKHKKNLVTTSYISNEMRKLDNKAKEVGVILLNECGLDPGIDHMSAMRIIHNIEMRGGTVVSFKSTTGALPSHEANNNPFGYKFSWSPRGVLLASRNSSKWLENGKIISIPGEKLFENYILQDIPEIGTFENYPNRNSIPYRDIYGLKEAKTVYRGTFRMTGWCETMRYIVALGWLSDEPMKFFSGKTYGDVTRHLIGVKSNKNLIKATAAFLDLEIYSCVIKRIEWLGLFSNESLPDNIDNPLDFLNVIAMKKMPLELGERDMVVMYHEFIAKYSSKKELINSVLINYGTPHGDSSISRTVALPAAIAVKMILKRKIRITGVHLPVISEIYNPILDELEKIGIKFKEEIAAL